MNYNVTLKEIALQSGVSISTVSKALNDSHEISSMTKQRIGQVAKSLNYRPNFFAKNLKKKQNYIIGVILPDLKNDFFSNLLIGITEETCDRGHRIMVYQTCNDLEKEISYTKLLSEDIIDGLIISPTSFPKRNTYDNKYLQEMSENHLPIILVDDMKERVIRQAEDARTALNSQLLGKDIIENLVNGIEDNNVQLDVS